MLINDKRNPTTLPIENIIIGNCFMYNNALYIKTNASEWIEQTNPNDCFCLRVANGRLTKLDKETMVTPVNTECNIITKNENPTTEEITPEKNTSKYIVIRWTRFDDELHTQQFDTESEAQNYMRSNYKHVLSTEKKYDVKINDNHINKTSAKIETEQDVFLWQIIETNF